MAEDTLTRAEEAALARAQRTVDRRSAGDGRRTSRAPGSRSRPARRRRGTGRSTTLDLSRGFALVLAVTFLLTGDPSRLPEAVRPVGGNGFGVADLLPATLTVLVGVSMAWQLAAHQRQSTGWWTLRLIRRVGVLVGVALLLAWLREPDLELVRFTGPLVRLAVGGVLAWLLVTRLSPRTQIAVATSLTVGHWFLLGRGVLGADGSLARLEAHLLGAHALVPVDPDGLTALGPTVVAIMAGVWIGRWLRERAAGTATVVAFVLAGVYATTGALAWAHVLPVNAVLWTGSTLLLAAGVVFLLLALSHLVAEVLPGSRPTSWIVAIGAQALPVYVLAVSLAALIERSPLGVVWNTVRTSLVEPLVGVELAPVTTAALGTVALARIAVALVARGRLLRA